MTTTSNPRYTKLPNPNPNDYYPNANPNYNHRSKNPNIKCDDIFFALFITVITFTTGVFMIILFALLIYHPNFPEFSVSSFEVSNFNLSSHSLTSDFNISIAILNPHEKWSVIHDKVHAAVLYSTGYVGDSVLKTNDFVIATTPMFPFSQGSQATTDLKVRLGTVGFYVNDEDRILLDDAVVRFGVRVYTKVWFKSWAWSTAAVYNLIAYCDDIQVGLSNSTVAGLGSMVGPARGCRVYQ